MNDLDEVDGYTPCPECGGDGLCEIDAVVAECLKCDGSGVVYVSAFGVVPTRWTEEP